MRSSDEGIFRKLLLALFVTALFLFPSVSFATSGNLNQETAQKIIARDPHSGAVVFKDQGAYYYGFPRAKKILKEGQIAPGEFIVKYKKHHPISIQGQNAIHSTVTKFAGKTKELNNQLGLALVQIPKDKNYFKTLKELAKNPNVEYAEPNYMVKAQYIPNDPLYSQQWGPKMIHAESAWEKVDPAKRAAVTIAILDTGINFNHEDLKESIVLGHNFVKNDNQLTDAVGHGTHVAGIAGALTNNAAGIAGIASGCKIMPIKVLDDDGSGSDSNIIEGIKYATDHGAQVISMSLGGPGSSNAIQDAVNYATSHGVNVVAAAGNENGPIDIPGNCQGVITVGAIDSNDQRSSYSNFGPKLDVVAPGSDILSTYIDSPSSYTPMSGTSMATPFVSGVVALIRAANPNLSPTAVIDILHRSATDLGDPGFDNYYGYGLINADKAVDLAIKEGAIPTPFPNPNPTPNPIPAPVPAPNVNLALHKNAIASSADGPARTADKAVDGNPGTCWTSQSWSGAQWIYVDLGKTYSINKVVLNWEKANLKSYEIQVSDDAWNWYTVYSTNSGLGKTTIPILTGSVYGRFVRMYGPQSCLPNGIPYRYSLREFEVYGHDM